jgi:putative transposase
MMNHVHIVAVPENENALARLVARLQSEYALAANRTVDRTGHLWQSRFFSCPLDEDHLLAALRYVDLNPVRAGLVRQATDWPWSSATSHSAANHRDPVLDARWQNWVRYWDYAEWRDLLATTLECDPEIIRLATHTGVPLGSREFVARLESRTGRRLQPRPRGRPGKMASDPILVDSSTGVY